MDLGRAFWPAEALANWYLGAAWPSIVSPDIEPAKLEEERRTEEGGETREPARDWHVAQESHAEMRLPRVARRPSLPARADIDEHFPLHLDFRSWCEQCVAGKARIAKHMVQASDRERLGVTVHMGYGRMTAEESMQPTLLFYDDGKKAMWALAVEQKGVTEAMVKYVVGILDQSGTKAKGRP